MIFSFSEDAVLLLTSRWFYWQPRILSIHICNKSRSSGFPIILYSGPSTGHVYSNSPTDNYSEATHLLNIYAGSWNHKRISYVHSEPQTWNVKQSSVQIVETNGANGQNRILITAEISFSIHSSVLLHFVTSTQFQCFTRNDDFFTSKILQLQNLCSVMWKTVCKKNDKKNENRENVYLTK